MSYDVHTQNFQWPRKGNTLLSKNILVVVYQGPSYQITPGGILNPRVGKLELEVETRNKMA